MTVVRTESARCRWCGQPIAVQIQLRFDGGYDRVVDQTCFAPERSGKLLCEPRVFSEYQPRLQRAKARR